ncbi:MAG: twin-arginine translocation signal domain-containing protein [Acidobacteriaceae bacterium]
MKNLSRRNFVGTAAAAGIAALTAAAPVHAQLVDRTTDWKMSDFHHLVQSSARMKQVYDVIPIGGGKFLNNIKNSLNGLHFGFGYPMDQIQVVAALHGPTNMMNYDDYVWQKYKIGEWLKVDDPKTGQPAARNIFYSGTMPHFSSKDAESEKSMYQSTQIEVLQARGVRFLSCHTASEEQARALIEHLHLSQSPDDIVNDWQAHTIPGVLIVASMVAAIAVLQCEGHYSYITV